MTRPLNGSLLLGALALASLLPACGPTRVQLSPRNVASVVVRPSSGKLVFCPGEAFQVEVLAQLKNNTWCSSTDRTRGCLGETDAVIDASSVRVQGSPGGIEGNPGKFFWNTSEDPLATASTGVKLQGWIQLSTPAGVERSPAAEARLKPVYGCRLEGLFGGGSGGNQGENGAPGPDLDIAVTTLSTPFYPNAALIRVISGTQRFYYISPSPKQPIRITSRAEDGGNGAAGANGQEGTAGKDASDACANGGHGEHGERGSRGGNGGDGGAGGMIRITLDAAFTDKLRGRILATSQGGSAGGAGPGGIGGKGGSAGKGGPSGPSCTSGGSAGNAGNTGVTGPAGRSGYAGPSGPMPVFAIASREALFGAELQSLRRIEGTKRLSVEVVKVPR
ncbi:MAG: hypothetical protein ABI134_11795 [Byssovorax sp.]